MKTILITGASSEVAQHLSVLFAKEKAHIILSARNTNRLVNAKKDLEVRFNIKVDLVDYDNVLQNIHQIDGFISCVGTMEGDLDNIVKVNFLNICVILTHVAEEFKKAPQNKFIAVIGSVAGDRGRAKNYYYGSAKAGLHQFLSGLRQELSDYRIQVLTIKPGFFYSKMTRDMKLPKLLTNTPQQVANDIYKAIKNNKEVVYTKGIWRIVMFIISLIPENIFKKMKF